MTTQTIRKMLAEPGSDDEINARIWCYENNEKYAGLINGFHHHTRGIVGIKTPCHTTSLDAAMSIGEKELKGWEVNGMVQYGCLTDTKMWKVSLVNQCLYEVCSAGIPTLPRAICDARLQALEQERKEK